MPELRAAYGDEGPDAAALLREANEQLLLNALREQDLAEQWGNAAQLERMVLNLLGNALKYAAPDMPVRVRLG